MEGAVRVFAGEFNRSSLSVQSSETGGGPYVVTPTGAWCRSMYLSGALTELSGSSDMVSCRLADPTGTFDLVIGGGRSEIADEFRRIAMPSFITVTGRAQIYQKNGSCSCSLRPESVHVVDRAVRDTWVLHTSDATIRRLEHLSGAIFGQPVDEQVRVAVAHYLPTYEQVREFIAMVESALSVVQQPATIPEIPADYRGIIIMILKEKQGERGIAIDDVIALAGLQGVPAGAAQATINDLIGEDEFYQPQKGTIKLL
jgi:RPA family protein